MWFLSSVLINWKPPKSIKKFKYVPRCSKSKLKKEAVHSGSGRALGWEESWFNGARRVTTIRRLFKMLSLNFLSCFHTWDGDFIIGLDKAVQIVYTVFGNLEATIFPTYEILRARRVKTIRFKKVTFYFWKLQFEIYQTFFLIPIKEKMSYSCIFVLLKPPVAL